MSELVQWAEKEGITLLHENEKGIYGDEPERCLDLLLSCSSPNLRATFDPANFVQCGIKPFPEAVDMLAPYVSCIHIKDARLEDGSVVPAGQGDGEVPNILSSFFAQGYSELLSIEPHLAYATAYQGFSGPQLFRVATHAIKSILRDLNQTWV